MKKRKYVVFFFVVGLFSISCGLLGGVSNLLGSQATGTVSDLWPDVPRIDGLTKSDIDLPLTARLAIQGFIKAGGLSEGSIEFIAFTTTNSTQALTDFYTLEKMQGAGWNLTDQPGCSGSTSQGSANGLMCLFGKESSDGPGTMLVIFAVDAENAAENQVFFARMDLPNMPTPSN